ncbi:MAG TPA: nucleoside hydrolase [Spirochaetia bacterium]|nr:nucleoside hydrolase [Spirochaetia bacterium]
MLHFSRPQDEQLLAALAQPDGEASVVFDTDAFNEIDDQYAIAYGALAPNLKIEAVYAAPFHNKRSEGPEDGMEKSHAEVVRLRDMLAGIDKRIDFPVRKGARAFLESDDEPVLSEAVDDLVERAMSRKEGRLFVVAIAAPTNIASALLAEPRIRDKIVVLWLGGQPYYWHTAWEFNLKQDPAASQILFDSGVPLVHVPCKNVAEHLRTTPGELTHFLHGRNALSEYLYKITTGFMETESMLSKVIWDVAPVAWLRQPGLVLSNVSSSPILTELFTWSRDASRHFVRVAYDVDRDGVFRDLFQLLGVVGDTL